MVHSRKVTVDGEEKTLTFGHEGVLYRRSFVMYDHETNTRWNHSTGLAMKGELAGKRLEFLNSQLVRWKDWKKRYPDTKVLLGRRKSGFMGKFLRKDPEEYGIVRAFGNSAKLYPFKTLSQQPVINDQFQNTPNVVVYNPEEHVALIYNRRIEGKTYHFEAYQAPDDDRLLMKDRETGSIWNRMTGKAIRGNMKGTQLNQSISVPWLIERFRSIYEQEGTIYRR